MNASKKIRVLVVDDMEINRRILSSILSKHSYDVVEADSAVQALDVMANQPADIALLDVMMPDVDGFTLCKELRKQYSANDLPILFVTAKSEDQDIVDGLEAGANDYLTKPLNSKIVLARVGAQARLLHAAKELKASSEKLSQKKRMETVGLFAAGVAHNFNNILGTVMGSAELIKIFAPSDPRLVKSSDLILSATKRAADLTESLLSFTKSTKSDICEDPEEVIRATLSILPLASNSKIKLELVSPQELPKLQIPPVHLSQILGELVKNSMEAIEQTGKILLEVAPSSDGEIEYLNFKVTDTGKGMDELSAQHLFEPFYSTKNTDTLCGIALDGSGLGLSQVYNLVTASGGDVHLLRTGPEGTVIEFKVPVSLR